jgi:CO/xanthine dehydrogenase Mo-binding subunit
MSDVPEIYVELIASDEHPSGVGQMPVTVVAPAIGNAVARLTNVRLRETPMTAERMKKAERVQGQAAEDDIALQAKRTPAPVRSKN